MPAEPHHATNGGARFASPLNVFDSLKSPALALDEVRAAAQPACEPHRPGEKLTAHAAAADFRSWRTLASRD
jgi:hypothetical protein